MSLTSSLKPDREDGDKVKRKSIKLKLGGFLFSLVALFVEVISYWYKKLWMLFVTRRPEVQLLESMRNAESYEEWLDLAYTLDNVMGNDLWRANPKSTKYDYRLISERLDILMEAKEMRDITTLSAILRSGLVRNLGNIANKKLFTYTGTKFLIEKYNVEVVESLNFLLKLPQTEFSLQRKLDFVHDTRLSYGLSTLVLQGGVLFGLCHLGVVKALYNHNLLPRIITGVGVGALIATLICVHRDEELPIFLDGQSLDLSAFTRNQPDENQGWNRLKRLIKKGYLLDVQVIEQVVKDNIGDLTFEEAYARTRRVLNVIVHSDDKYVPNVFNFLTTPNVVIRSAACASNALPGLFEEVEILCKNEEGEVVPWIRSGNPLHWKSWASTRANEREAPYTRISELFNVNHLIVSQAHPYIVPFVSSDFHVGSKSLRSKLFRLIGLEILHRLMQLETLGLLPLFLKRLLMLDDSRLMNSEIVTVVPYITLGDFWKLFTASPRSSDDVMYWNRKGEQSTWFSLPVIRQRCGVEFVLDAAYDSLFKSKRNRRI
ncbi:hypothetical protein V1511DRAFT_298451 [Dipodascopsis uninucleata]